jgi:hypothetical protein
MMSKETKFWKIQENRHNNPVEVTVTKIKPDIAVSFIHGCSKAYNLVKEIAPDVIFMPERGIGPIGWTFEVFEQDEDRNFFKVSLPIGTYNDIATGDVRGIDKPTKYQTIDSGVKFANTHLKGIKNPLLIDEVQSGGTIKIASDNLIKSLKDLSISSTLNIIALQDSSNGWLTHNKAGGYRKMTNNLRPDIHAWVLELPYFSIDRQEYLNYILYDSNAPVELRATTQMTLINTEARNLFRTLTYGYLYPKKLNDTLLANQQGKIIAEKNLTNMQEIELPHLVDKISTIYADNKISKADIAQWLFSYTTKVQEAKANKPII